MMNSKVFEDYLDLLFPNPRCELNYNKDWELLIATVLSAQTTDKRVNEVTKVLFKKYDSLKKLSEASVDDIRKIIKPIGMVSKKGEYVIEIAKFLLDNCNGIVPNDSEILVTIPGVGRKTSNVVRGVLFNAPAIAVDTHVNRISKRLGLADEEDDVLTVEKKLMDFFPKDHWSRVQLQLVLFGRYHCTSKNPQCDNCKLKDICSYKH